MHTKHITHYNSVTENQSFGSIPNGDKVSMYELVNSKGMQMKVMSYGATLISLKVPLKKGDVVDVVLGFETVEEYMKSYDLPSAPYFGAIIGRFAGRISNGEFNLGEKKYLLNKNNNGNSLHGGNRGFSQENWKLKSKKEGKNPSVTFTYFSKHNEEFFPGDLTIDVTYTLTDDNEMIVEYTAHSSEDTILNVTHHSYFNLDGHQQSVLDQEIQVNSKQIVETTPTGIPTGRFLNVVNTPFDFTNRRNCPAAIDTTFVVNKVQEPAASLNRSDNLLRMTVYTNQPAVHLYVGGNCFGKIKGKENAAYHPTSGICFETQNFPDAPNHSHFPSALLKKGELYYHKTIYKFNSF